jgi:hypothetical protein
MWDRYEYNLANNFKNIIPLQTMIIEILNDYDTIKGNVSRSFFEKAYSLILPYVKILIEKLKKVPDDKKFTIWSDTSYRPFCCNLCSKQFKATFFYHQTINEAD